MYMGAFFCAGFSFTEDRHMLKKILFAVILIVSFGAVAVSSAGQPEMTDVKLYFVDAGMMRLVPIRTTLYKTDKAHEAKAVLNALIAGRDNNPKIRRMIPDIKKCMTVRIRENTAYVNITQKMIDAHPDGRDAEMLTVYQIVNSLTCIDGIANVKFTINGSTQKEFMGYLDMRETFIPDYLI